MSRRPKPAPPPLATLAKCPTGIHGLDAITVLRSALTGKPTPTRARFALGEEHARIDGGHFRGTGFLGKCFQVAVSLRCLPREPTPSRRL